MITAESNVANTLTRMQGLRPDVPLFVLLDGINAMTTYAIRKALQSVKGDQEEIDIIIDSPGGSPDHAYKIVKLFRGKYKTVNIIVPLWAKSAATLIAFGGSRLVMHESAELGPIDAQIKKDNEEDPKESWASALNVQSSLEQIEKRSRIGMVAMYTNLLTNEDIKLGRKQLAEMLLTYSADFYQPLMQKIDAYEIGEMARYLEIGMMYAKRILIQFTETDPVKRDELLDFLVYECPDHGYVIDLPLLKPYLGHVESAKDSETFGGEYYMELDDLSILLMANTAQYVGFWNHKPEADTIESDERESEGPESSDVERSSSGSSANKGTKKPRQDAADKKSAKATDNHLQTEKRNSSWKDL